MTRIRKAHVHIRVVDGGRARSYPCVPEEAPLQVEREHEMRHPTVAMVPCLTEACAGYVEEPPALPPAVGQD